MRTGLPDGQTPRSQYGLRTTYLGGKNAAFKGLSAQAGTDRKRNGIILRQMQRWLTSVFPDTPTTPIGKGPSVPALAKTRNDLLQ